MSLNATYADCVVLDEEDDEEAAAEADDASLFDDLEDRVALDKIPPFFGLLLPEEAPPPPEAEGGTVQYGLSAARPIVSASSKSSWAGFNSRMNFHSKIPALVSPPPMSASSSSSSSWKVM